MDPGISLRNMNSCIMNHESSNMMGMIALEAQALFFFFFELSFALDKKDYWFYVEKLI